MPEKYICKYSVASGSTSIGVFIILSIYGVINMPTPVNTTPITSVIKIAVWTALFTFSSCFAP